VGGDDDRSYSGGTEAEAAAHSGPTVPRACGVSPCVCVVARECACSNRMQVAVCECECGVRVDVVALWRCGLVTVPRRSRFVSAADSKQVRCTSMEINSHQQRGTRRKREKE